MENDKLTEKIIGCSYTVYNTLGSGFLESVYEKSLLIELKKAGLSCRAQLHVDVFYDEQKVGDFIADIIVENKVVVELKSTETLVKIHEVQLVNYLVATGIDTGLLINFGPDGVQIKRKTRLLT